MFLGAQYAAKIGHIGNPMMSHSPGSVKSAFVCGTICGCSKGWKVVRFCQKKSKNNFSIFYSNVHQNESL